MEKLYWKKIHECNFDINDNYLEKILKSKGVEDVRSFLNVNINHTHDPFLFKNMKQGLKLFRKALGKHIYIQVDSDADGYTSATYVRKFIEEIAPNTKITYGLHYKKEHGLNIKDVEKIEGDVDLIIVPDASIDTKEEAEKIVEIVDCPILILDHHEINKEILPYTTLINCKDGQYPNSTLSGVGVVHKFFLAYCQEYGLKRTVTDKYLDLVALGMIADSMDMRNLETRYYTLEGLKEENRNNLLIEELAERFSDEMKLGHTITNYGWVIAPKINGCIRFGKPKEQLDLFRAMCGEKEDIEYQPRRKRKTDPKPPKEIHSLQKTMARICSNAKGRQDNQARKIMKTIDEQIIKHKLYNDSVIIIDGTDLLGKESLSGLVANKLADKYKRPIVILKKHPKEESMFGGSGRGYDKGKIENFREFLLSTKQFQHCKGHDNAFGVLIDKNKVVSARKECNKKLPKEDLITIYDVDYEIKASKLTNKAIEDVAKSFAMWGNKVDEPTFAITDIKIEAKDIIGYGEHKGFIKFKYGDIDFIKKYCPKEDFENMTLADRYTLGENKKKLNLSVIGNFVYNIYEGNAYPQVRIKHFYSEERVEEKEEISLEDIF